MTTHLFQTFPGGSVAPDSTLAPPGVVEIDPTTKRVPSMLRIHLQDANLPAGCNPYAAVSVGLNCARSKQLLSSENHALATTGYAFFDEQFVVEYDPRASRDTFVSVAFFERTTNAPLGEWRAPLSRFDHASHSSNVGKHGTATASSWELLDAAGVPLAPYTGHISGATTPVAGTAATPATTAPTTASLSAVPTQTPTPVTTTSVGTAGAAALPLATGALGSAHIRVRFEPKLVGTLRLSVREVILANGSVAPLLLNVKFVSPEQKFTTPAIAGGAGGRFVFGPNEFLLHVDSTNNVRDVFVEVVQNGNIIGETRVTLYDAYRPGGLADAQPILVHSTKQRIGEMLLGSSFDGKPQKR